jgi:hypothetical protein
MNAKVPFLFLVGGALVAPLPAQPDSTIIYSNSFETSEDTTAWSGYGNWGITVDPAPDQGTRSFLIGGGCIQPAAWIDVPCTTGAGRYRLSLWGKAVYSEWSGGSVALSRAAWEPSEEPKIEIHVVEPSWTPHSSEIDITLEENDTLRIQIQVGGYIYDEMLLDALEVTRIADLSTHGEVPIPADFCLLPLYPNPFNLSVTIRWSQARSAEINVIVFDVTGRLVAQPVAELFPPGSWSLNWQPEGLPSGLYLFRLSAPGYHQIQKGMLLK